MRRHSLNHIVRCGGYINKAQEKKIKIWIRHLCLVCAYVVLMNYFFFNIIVEGGILYWHFVDVVWLFLYVSIYYWGS